MTTRRNFLRGAAASGIAFCSCAMLNAAHAQPKAPRLPVKVNGKHVLTVDVHAHCYFREAINLMGDGADKVLPPVKGVPEHFIAIEQRLKEMDAMAIETAVKKQGLRGAAIGGSVLGEDFSDPKFHPVWAKAEELGAVLFIHPQSTPELAKRFKGNGWLSNTIGNPLDTTIALQK